MGLKWKYSQLLASAGFDHSGGCPSIGQTFLCSAFPPQPQTAMRLRVKAKRWKKPVRVVTLHIFSDCKDRGNARAFGLGAYQALGLNRDRFQLGFAQLRSDMRLVSRPLLFAIFFFLLAWPVLAQVRTCEKRQLPVFVTEKDGNVVTNLTSADFKLKGHSASMSVVTLKHDERRHRVVIMLDVSGSMGGGVGSPLWPVVMALARHASNAGGENSDLAFVLFSDHVLETVGFSQGKVAIQRRLAEIAKDRALPEPGKANDSRIYDTLKEEALMLNDPASADSLLVITDGLDQGSKTRPDEILNLLSSSMIRVFTILADPIQGQPSSVGPDAFVRIVQRSGGKVFGPIGSNNAAFRKSAKMAEAQKMMEEQLGQFYRGILANDVLVIETPSVILKPEPVDLTLTDSARHEMKKLQIHFPHEIGPCPEIGSSRQKVE
jgi:hypothetical protein